ncbi:MAG: hypothetical protein H0V10_13670 [Geodermatophilaceae bacterium]|nr:hypothetical protein [Geodermatophilaceae bacterium]
MTESPRAMVGRSLEGVAILGTAAVIPETGARLVDNDEIDHLLTGRGQRTMSAEWLAMMGVQRRLWTCVPGDPPAVDAASTDSMLAEAIEATIADAGIDRSDVDMVVAATTTTSRLTTSMAAVATGRLGMQCATMEVRAGCASAAYGLATAYAHLGLGAGCVVVVAAETITKVAPGTGPPAYLAGDGAAGVALARTDTPGSGLVASWLSGDGSLSALAGPPGTLPPNQADLDQDRYRLVMDKRFDEAAAPWWPVGPTSVLDAAGVRADAVDALVMNQANRFRLVQTADKVGVPADALVDVVGKTANAGAASMLVALDRACRTGRAGPGSTVLVAGVGGGLCAAALVLHP